MDKYQEINLFSLELGSELCKKETLDQILQSASYIRKSVFYKRGVAIPAVRIRSNPKLEPFEYSIKIYTQKIDGFILQKNKTMILDNGNVTKKMRGIKSKDPVFNVEILFISSNKEKEAEENGYLIIKNYKIIEIHLYNIIMRNLSAAITTEYVIELLDEISHKTANGMVTLFAGLFSYHHIIIKKVLKQLVNEGVSIRNINPILETMIDLSQLNTQSTEIFIERCRQSIALDIVTPFANKNTINFIQISENLCEYFQEHKEEIINYNYLDRTYEKKIQQELSKITNETKTSVVVCPTTIRIAVSIYLHNFCRLEDITVISSEEMLAVKNIAPNYSLKRVAQAGENIVVPTEQIQS